MKTLFMILSLLLLPVIALCNDIKGNVKDENKSPVAYVNVIALNNDSLFVCGTTTDSLGYFSLTIPDTVNFFLKFSCVGYETKYVVPSGKVLEVDVRQNTNIIDGITVTAPVPSIKLTADGILTNVQGTSLAQLGTAEDVLRHVPTLIKNGESWTVFGRGTPVIYLNNRLLINMAELDNLRSDEIKSVEVIRSPGAKYSASVNAVLRIKTIKRKGEGISINARSKYSRFKDDCFTEQLDLNYRHNMFNAFFSYEYVNKKSIQDAKLAQTAYVDTIWHQENDNYDKHKSEWHELIGGISYDWGKENSAGIRYSATLTGDQHSSGYFDTRVYANNKLYDKLSTSSYDKSFDAPIHEIDAYYNGKLGSTDIYFNGDAYFSDNKKKSEMAEGSREYDSRTLFSTSKSKSSMFASKLIIVSPLFKGKFTYGAEASVTRRKDTYSINRTDIVPDANSKIHEQSIAPFIEYTHSLGKETNLTAGLRYEDVRFRYYENGIFLPDQSRTFRNIFPSIFLNTQTGKISWQFSYTARTYRPSYSQLSNNISYSNRFTRQSGNPLLTHQTAHLVSLVGVWKWLQMIAQYQDTRRAIIYWAEQMPDAENITLIRYRNIKSLKSFTFFLSATPTIGVWSPQISGGIIKPWLDLETHMGEYRLNKPIFSFSFNNMFEFRNDWSCNVDFSYQSKGNTQNAKVLKDNFVLNLGISKSFFKKALTIGVRGYDLFYKSWDSFLLYSDRMTFQQVCKRGTRQLCIDVKYKFNVTRSKYRGTGAGDAEKDRL